MTKSPSKTDALRMMREANFASRSQPKEHVHASDPDRSANQVRNRDPKRWNSRLLVQGASGTEPKSQVAQSADLSAGSPAKRGRPRVDAPKKPRYEPWTALGLTERTYYRRKAEEKAK